jgi:hypothetical protein
MAPTYSSNLFLAASPVNLVKQAARTAHCASSKLFFFHLHILHTLSPLHSLVNHTLVNLPNSYLSFKTQKNCDFPSASWEIINQPAIKHPFLGVCLCLFSVAVTKYRRLNHLLACSSGIQEVLGWVGTSGEGFVLLQPTVEGRKASRCMQMRQKKVWWAHL